MSDGLESLGEIMGRELLSRAAPPEEADGDFRNADGLLCCGVCGQQKECRTEIMGRVFTVPCLCKCGEEEWDRKEQEWQEEQRRIRIENLRVSGIADDSLRDVRFEDSDGCENIQKCQAFVDNWDEIKAQHIGLLMSGPVGTGKTYAAACIANALIDRGVPVLMTNFPTILSTSKFEMNELVRQAMEYVLIIVDDLGVERDTEYSSETVYQFIDACDRRKKPMIVTTNLSLKDLRVQEGIRYKRIYDRVLKMCVPMVFTGESRRVEIRKEKANVLREIVFGKPEES